VRRGGEGGGGSGAPLPLLLRLPRARARRPSRSSSPPAHTHARHTHTHTHAPPFATADDDKPADYLLPQLLAMKVGDVASPTVEEARAADAAVRATYERRLRAKLAGLKAKRSALLDEQMEAQQIFHRNRNPSPAQSADFRAAMEAFAFRLSVVEARIGEEHGALATRMAAFVDTLRLDQRLQSVYDPRGYIERMEREGKI
jgi:hypothetical protein